MKKLLGIVGGLALFALAWSYANSATLSLFSGPNCAEASQLQSCLNQTINAINSGVTPQSMATWGNFRNFLDNGAMTVQQRGTSAQTCGTNTAPTFTAYAADRWVCDVNVAVGAGRLQVVTSSPTPPPGFSASQNLFRTSGALTQPVCVFQEVLTSDTIALQGRQVTFSVYLQALAGLNADNSNAANLFIIYGTGSDEGFGTLTASPAITPAWTGINSSITSAVTLTTAWARYSVSGFIPITAKEIGVAICFTPTATGSGATDGLSFVGAQLEDGASASAFEFRPLSIELAKAQRYYYRYAEKAATYALNAFCQATGANTNSCTLAVPVPMRSIPTITITTAGTFKVNIAGSLTTIATPTAGNCDLTACIVTAANTNTAGQVEQLTGAAGGSGVWEVSADF